MTGEVGKAAPGAKMSGKKKAVIAGAAVAGLGALWLLGRNQGPPGVTDPAAGGAGVSDGFGGLGGEGVYDYPLPEDPYAPGPPCPDGWVGNQPYCTPAEPAAAGAGDLGGNGGGSTAPPGSAAAFEEEWNPAVLAGVPQKAAPAAVPIAQAAALGSTIYKTRAGTTIARGTGQVAKGAPKVVPKARAPTFFIKTPPGGQAATTRLGKVVPGFNVAYGTYQGVGQGLHAKEAGHGQAWSTGAAAVGGGLSAGTWGFFNLDVSKDRNAVELFNLSVAEKKRTPSGGTKMCLLGFCW